MATFRLITVAAVTAAFLLAVPAAQAADIVSNGGFELTGPTSTGAADWQDASGGCSAPTRDTSVFHSGSASMLMETGDPNTCSFAGVANPCVAVTGDPYFGSLWYLIMPNELSGMDAIRLSVAWISGPGCSGQFTSEHSDTASLIADGNWHQFTPALNGSATAQSAYVFVEGVCNGGNCGGTAFFHVDDFSLDTMPPTAVKVRSLSAKRAGLRRNAIRGIAVR